MSPSLGAINQNILMTSDYFIVPTTADFFSVMAINSLTQVLPRWYAWGKAASSLQVLKDANYPFPQIRPRFLGAIIQNFRTIGGKETKAFEKWIQKIEEDISSKLVPILRENNMLISSQIYAEQGIDNSFYLTKIPNFNSLITLSQEHRTPVYALTSQQLGQTGTALEGNQRKQAKFRDMFSDLADKIIGLTSEVYALSA
jgi:cellulose biosynthesis protein BcsQ